MVAGLGWLGMLMSVTHGARYEIIMTKSEKRRSIPPHLCRALVGLLLVMVQLAGAELVAETPGPQVTVLSGIVYRDGELDEKTTALLSLDLYLPPASPERTKRFPAMVWFHGGGLEGGDKASKLTAALARRYAADGVAVASANYRLSPAVQAPVYIQDAAAAVAWVVEHIAEQGGDAQSIFVSGHSAGGYLAAILGADPHYLAEAGVAEAQIAGFIPVSGQTFTHFTIRKERGIPDPENSPIIDTFGPAFYAARAKQMRPFLVLCGDHDWPVRAEENRFFVAMIQHCGAADAAYLQIDDRTHGSIIGKMTDPADPAATAILAFIAAHRR
jgi:dipeptidyl aminopeptidase/acylaminoacyl peptidase